MARAADRAGRARRGRAREISVRDDVKLAVESLLREGFVIPDEVDEDRLAITPAGAAQVEQWLRRTVPLFGGWPPTIAGVDDV